MRAIRESLEKMPKYIDQSRSALRTRLKQFVEIELETITGCRLLQPAEGHRREHCPRPRSGT